MSHTHTHTHTHSLSLSPLDPFALSSSLQCTHWPHTPPALACAPPRSNTTRTYLLQLWLGHGLRPNVCPWKFQKLVELWLRVVWPDRPKFLPQWTSRSRMPQQTDSAIDTDGVVGCAWGQNLFTDDPQHTKKDHFEKPLNVPQTMGLTIQRLFNKNSTQASVWFVLTPVEWAVRL